MIRILASLICAFFAALPVAAQQPKAKDQGKHLEIRWFGQSFFQVITSDGTKIVFDPHAMPECGRNVVWADLVLCSHLHNDHTNVMILENADKAKVLYGLNEKDKGRTYNDIDEKFKNVKIRTVHSFHDEEEGLKRGKNAIFIVEADGLKIVHLGDLGHALSDEQVKEIGEVDILMIPIGGIYTINGGEAKEVIKQLKPRLYILPMHYGTKVIQELQGPDEFLDGQKSVRKLEPSNLLEVPLNLKLDAPTVVMLGWSSGK
jgi:L-ascorbate metabolism protein UlaG (beta-lactamase superfamily)